MASVNVVMSWVPRDSGASSGQKVQYKKRNASSWTTLETVQPNVSSYTFEIDDAEDDEIFDFRVVNVCNGVEYPSAIVSRQKSRRF